MLSFEGLSSVKSDENHGICEKVIILILFKSRKEGWWFYEVCIL
jgi:hypothetical protein